MNKKTTRMTPKYTEYLVALVIVLTLVTVGPVIAIYLFSLLVGLGLDAFPIFFFLLVFGGWAVSRIDKTLVYKQLPSLTRIRKLLETQR